MILSETEQFIFIHNPKCAGTSVREALRGFDTTGDFFWMFDEWNGLKIDKAHAPLYVLRQKYPHYFSLFDEFFTFMFVRNPYDRFVSAFNEQHPGIYNSFVQSNDVVDYRGRLNSFIASLWFNVQSLFRSDLHRFIRQVDLAYVDRKCRIDLILKVEEWDASLEKIDVFNHKIYQQLKSAEKIHQRPMRFSYRELLTEESLGKINSIYHEDFVLFDYAKES